MKLAAPIRELVGSPALLSPVDDAAGFELALD
jgi:hypothetical protein